MHLVFETLELVKVSISKFDFSEKLNIIFFQLNRLDNGMV